MRVVGLSSDSTIRDRRPASASDACPERAAIVVLGPREARIVWLEEGTSRILGRALPADLVLDDQSLSRQHARLCLSGGRLHVSDLGSITGMWLDRRRVTETWLAPSQVLRMGDVVLSLPALASGTLERAARSDRSEVIPKADPAHDEIVQSPGTAALFALARRAARSELPMLVLGETGTGKEVLARMIHDHSPRRNQVLRVVNCGALPPSLMESVLFGHEKGAFTGATQAQAGVFEQADGGTLFLDEVGELSPAAQAALLRVLETKSLTRIGASAERKVNVRVLAATHRALDALCAQQRFREDLMHRLNAVTLTLPPLRERRQEVPIFVERFLLGRDLPADCARRIAPDALARLCAYGWPGNVRQLKNAVERAAVLARGPTIELDDLSPELREQRPGAHAPPVLAMVTPLGETVHEPAAGLAFRQRLQQHEADLIRRALAQSKGNRTVAARLLRMPLRTLTKRLKEYGID